MTIVVKFLYLATRKVSHIYWREKIKIILAAGKMFLQAVENLESCLPSLHF